MVCEDSGSRVDDVAMATSHVDVWSRACNLVAEDSVKTCASSNAKGNRDGRLGESQANGFAMGAVKESKGVIQSLRLAVEKLHGLDSASHVVPRLVRHAGSVIERSRRGSAAGHRLSKGKASLTATFR